MEKPPLNLNLEDKLITIKLGVISPHARYDNYKQLLAMSDYIMTASNRMTDWAMHACLTIHPITVVKPKGKASGHFICVAGLRTLLLAQSILGLEAKAQVILRQRPRDDEIDFIISADILFAHLLFSVKKPETLGRIFNMVPPDHLSSLLVESACSKTGFAKLTDYAYNTLFPKPKTP